MEITALSASELSRLIATRALLPSDVMAAFLDRIDSLNGAINAVVSLRDRDALMAEARAADGMPSRGWLHGMPFAVKDLCATKGLRTTWGSPLFADFVPAADELLAARMRAAGAIFIGKTNAPEWGQGSHSYNPVFGVTRNPYDLTRSAGGSSGGAAAALAARMLPVADGSDMMGSLRNPAAFCNVYGFRPSFGLVPNDPGDDSYTQTLATNGPLGRTVEDVARLLQVQAGPVAGTPGCRPSQPFADLLETDIKGARIGWLGDWGGAYGCESGILGQCESGLRVFEALGAAIEPVAPPFPAEQLWQAWTTQRAMLSAGRMRGLYGDPAKRALLKPETRWEIEQGLTLDAQAVYEALAIRGRWYDRVHRLFEVFDALVLPTAQVWPFPADWTWPREIEGRAMDTYHRWMEVVIPVSLAGLPALSLPVGFGARGLPMGMQLFGAAGTDARILALGEQYHRATDWPAHQPPPARTEPV
jgi:amidase